MISIYNFEVKKVRPYTKMTENVFALSVIFVLYIRVLKIITSVLGNEYLSCREIITH